MALIRETTVDFAIYEDGDEFLGVTKVTLPDLTNLTTTINGAGMSGNIETLVMGQIDAMTMTLNFRTSCPAALKLSEPRSHQIDLRPVQQFEDTVTGVMGLEGIKHVMTIVPKSTKWGTVSPASPTDGSGEYAVRQWTVYMDGEKVQEIDQFNSIFMINGVDYMADVRAALGK